MQVLLEEAALVPRDSLVLVSVQTAANLAQDLALATLVDQMEDVRYSFCLVYLYVSSLLR